MPIDSGALADAIEQVVLSRRNMAFSTVALQELLSRRFGVDALDVSDAVHVMHDRALILGDRYPFSLASSVVRVVRDAELYEVLLHQSRYTPFRDLVSPRVSSKQSKAFEDTVEFCLGGLFGEGTRSVNFGWPSSCGRPQEFDRAVRWLGEKMGIADAGSFRPPRRRDGGVDVIVWRSFGDGRPGLLLALVQATLEVDSLRLKASDVDVAMWRHWLGLDAVPVVLLATPGSITSVEEWNEISVNAVLLDRMRLLLLAPSTKFPTASLIRDARASHTLIDADLDEYL